MNIMINPKTNKERILKRLVSGSSVSAAAALLSIQVYCVSGNVGRNLYEADPKARMHQGETASSEEKEDRASSKQNERSAQADQSDSALNSEIPADELSEDFSENLDSGIEETFSENPEETAFVDEKTEKESINGRMKDDETSGREDSSMIIPDENSSEDASSEELTALEVVKKREAEKMKLEAEMREKERIRLEQEKQELENLRIQKELEEKRKREREERLNRNDPERNMFFRKEVRSQMGDVLKIIAPSGAGVFLVKNKNFTRFYGGVSPRRMKFDNLHSVSPETSDLTEILQNQKGSFMILLKIPDKKSGESVFYLPEMPAAKRRTIRVVNIYSDGRDLLLVDGEDKKENRFFYRWAVNRILVEKSE